MSEPSQSPTTLASVVGDYQFTERIVPVTNVPTLVANASPDRCYLAFIIGVGGSNAGVSTRAGVAMADGYPVTPSQSPLEFFSRHHPGIIAAAWYAVGTIGSNITVVEVIYRPRG